MSKSRKPVSGKYPTVNERSVSGRLGFMEGEITVPDDFDQMGKDEVATLFDATTIATRGYDFNRKDANKR